MLLRADSISSPRGPPPPEINGVKRFVDPFMPPLGCNMTKCGPTNAVVIGVSVVVVDELPSMMIGGTGVEGRRGRSAKAAGLEAADDVKKMGELLLLLQLLLLEFLAEVVVAAGGEPPPPLLVKEAHEEEEMAAAPLLLLLALALLVVVVLELMVSLICSPLADCQTARSMESA